MPCDKDTSPVLPPIDFQAAIRAIANPVRRQILQWLKDPQRHFPDQEYGQALGVCMGQITLRCGLSQSTVSGHLALLKGAGLIREKKSGTVCFLSRDEACIQQVQKLLAKQLQAE
jgi:ArsR family transcriptional regulator